MGQYISETSRNSVIFTLEVEVPAEQATAFASSMTGNDDDVILAAETAIRRRLEHEIAYPDEPDVEVEIGCPDERDVTSALRTFGENSSYGK